MCPVRTITGLFLAVALLGPGAVQAQQPQAPAVDYDAMMRKVADKLFVAAQNVDAYDWKKDYPKNYLWPPQLVINPSNVMNAYSSGEPVDPKTLDAQDKDVKTVQPRITVYQAWLDTIVEGKESRLAEVLGHELSHILLQHITAESPASPLIALAVTRDQESAADLLGFKIAVKAEYKPEELVEAYLKVIKWSDSVNFDYNSVKSLIYDHPAWADRIAAVDTKHPQIRQAFVAFQSGVQFLTYEQYPLAIRCFQEVTRLMPDCYEGWANLGYAELMQYCDKLSADDMRRLNIGHLVTGGFYRQANELERGVDRPLWDRAVAALEQAMSIQPGFVLPKANLAIAYLVAPDGDKFAKAQSLFTDAIATIDGNKAEQLDLLARASVFINAGVAALRAGDTDRGQACFDKATKTLESNKDGEEADDDSIEEVNTALRYNQAIQLAAANSNESRSKAKDLFESFLSQQNSRGQWWPLAYESYKQVCQQLGVEPRPEAGFSHRREEVRPVVAITLPDDQTVGLSNSMDEVLQMLGPATKQDVAVQRTNLRILTYPDRGLQIIGTDRVLTISTLGPTAPPVPVRIAGAEGQVRQIQVGMSLVEFEAALGNPDEIMERPILNPDVLYRYYTDLGFGIRIAGGFVTEIMIAQLPSTRASAQ